MSPDATPVPPAALPQIGETSVVVDPDDEMPLPSDPCVILLGGLFVLALLATLYFASPIVLPLVLAFMLNLLLQPLVRGLNRVGVPRAAGAAVAILLLVAIVAGLVSAIAAPGASWAAKLPDAIPKLQEKLAFLQQPLATMRWMMQQLQSTISGSDGVALPPAAAPAHMNLLGALFSGTATVAAGLFTTLLVVFYLLVSGDIFLRRMVEILPRFGEKRQAVETTLHIQRDISKYLITVTLINAAVGACTLAVMWACGVTSPLLWGVVAFVVNYVPILGPAAGLIIFLMASVLSIGVTWWAVLPVGLYFCVHLIESEFVTPQLIAHRFTLNPVMVIVALVFWYWMWGVVGAILAVPILATAKILCDDVRPLRAFGHLLEG